jgi:hypothetical protein
VVGTETPKVIKSHDMIRMRVGIKHGINFLNVRPERLYPEFGAGIHDPGAVVRFHVDRGPQPFVPRIFGPADLACAADHGHSR